MAKITLTEKDNYKYEIPKMVFNKSFINNIKDGMQVISQLINTIKTDEYNWYNDALKKYNDELMSWKKNNKK